MASSPITNVPSGVGGSTYYGAMGGPTGRAKSSLPFAYDTLGKHPDNLSWPLVTVVWDGVSAIDKEALNIHRIKQSLEILAAAEKNPLPLPEISTELARLKELGDKALYTASTVRDEKRARTIRLEALGHFIVQLPALEKCIQSHQRRGSSVGGQAALLGEVKKIQARLTTVSA